MELSLHSGCMAVYSVILDFFNGCKSRTPRLYLIAGAVQFPGFWAALSPVPLLVARGPLLTMANRSCMCVPNFLFAPSPDAFCHLRQFRVQSLERQGGLNWPKSTVLASSLKPSIFTQKFSKRKDVFCHSLQSSDGDLRGVSRFFPCLQSGWAEHFFLGVQAVWLGFVFVTFRYVPCARRVEAGTLSKKEKIGCWWDCSKCNLINCA